MEKHFATYDQSLDLKELGYDEPCFGYYILKDNQLYYDTIIDRKDNVFRNNSSLNCFSDLKVKIGAPLKSQVFEWFIEKYSIVGYVVPHNGKWTYKIISNKINIEINSFKTYVDAESSCIDKLIEIVKNR